MHGCGSVPIAMVLRFAVLRAAGAPLFKDIVIQSKLRNKENMGKEGGKRENMLPFCRPSYTRVANSSTFYWICVACI